MNLFVKNFKTDINKVKWVRTDYAYPIMCEHEKTIESLEADNALLKTAGEDLLEAVKDSNSQLSKSTEVVSLLKDKVKDLESALKEIHSINWGYDGDCGATRIIDNVLD